MVPRYVFHPKYRDQITNKEIMSDGRCSVSVILLHSWILFIVRDSFFPAIQLKFSLTWLPPITPNYKLKPLDYCEQFSSLPSPTSTFLQKFPEPITGLYWMSGSWNPQVYSMELRSGVWSCTLKACSLFLVILLIPSFQKVPTIKAVWAEDCLEQSGRHRYGSVEGTCGSNFNERE